MEKYGNLHSIRLLRQTFREIRPLVDTFRMYLCADTDTFSQNVSVPIQIQYQKMYRRADTDTFWQIFDQKIHQKFLLNKMEF